jgi:hypothetical protein
LSAEESAGVRPQDGIFDLLKGCADHRGGSEDGDDQRRSRFGWKVREAKLSDRVLVLRVEPQPSAGESEGGNGRGGQAPGSGEQMSLADLKENLRTLMRRVANRAADHDLMRPTVAVIDPSSLSESGIKEVRSWPADQEWHQGAFLLFVCKDSDESEGRVDDLLSAQPPEFTRYSPPKQRSNFAIIEQLRQGDLPGDLIAASHDAVGTAESAGDSAQRETVIEEVLRSWVRRKVDASVSSMRGSR